MARPKKKPEALRRHNLKLRFTDGEYSDLKSMALAAGVTATHYARETILGRRPKARALNQRLLDEFLNELRTIATNLSQLETVTSDASFNDWADYMGGRLVELVVDRDELMPLIEGQLNALNAAGQLVNQLAHTANAGKPLDEAQINDALEALREVTTPIHEAVTNLPAEHLSKRSEEERLSSRPDPGDEGREV